MANNPNLALLSSNLQTKVLENRNELFEFLTLGLVETLTNTGARVYEDIKGKLVLPNIDSVSMVQSGGTIGNESFSRRFNTNARPSFHVIKIVNSTAPIIIGTQPPDRIFNDVEATNTKSISKNGTANSATFHTGQRHKP
jgi:hypothetical protein